MPAACGLVTSLMGHGHYVLLTPFGNVLLDRHVKLNHRHSQAKFKNCCRILQALNCLACFWLGQPVSTWRVEMGWPDIHWLAGDQGGLVAAISDVSMLGSLETP
jgi:hypothetical protein